MTANYRSIFDIIGPTMIGPSSSHTAGAVKIGRAARKIFVGQFHTVQVDYYESFAATHKGHGTDYAIVAGVLGFKEDDPRVPDAVTIARDRGIKIVFIEHTIPSPIGHPNTAIVTLEGHHEKIKLAGCSIGGGTIEVRQIELLGQRIKLRGPLPTLVCMGPRKNLLLAEEKLKNEHINVLHKRLSKFKYEFIQELNTDKLTPPQTLNKLAQMCSRIIEL